MLREFQSVLDCLQHLWPSAVNDPTGNVIAGEPEIRKEEINIGTQVFPDYLRHLWRKHDAKPSFRNVPAHHVLRPRIEDRAGGDDLRAFQSGVTAGNHDGGCAIAKQ